MLERRGRPSTFFTVGSSATVNVLCATGQVNFSIPGSVDVYNFAGNSETGTYSPVLAAMRRHKITMNRRTTGVLVKLIRKSGPARSIRGQIMEAHLIIQKAAEWL